MDDTLLIGLDWGTTQLGAYRFDRAGDITQSRQLPSGIMQIMTQGGAAEAGFAQALEQACGDWLRARPACPILACGMIGSAQGWREAPYLEVPASLSDLGRTLTRIEIPGGAVLHIIPGLIERGRLPEVLRGEETQIAGVMELGLDAAVGSGADTWIGLPGTHSKWVLVRDRRVVHFHTFLTGEVFAALCAHTILGRTMRPAPAPTPEASPAWDLGAFDRGVEVARAPEGRAGPLSTIFSTRTLGLVGALAPQAQADYLSGLLIGHELAALDTLGHRLGPAVLVGRDDLCRRYQRALAAFGHAPGALAAGATERGLWRVAVWAGLVSPEGPC